jgi:flagellin-like protein
MSRRHRRSGGETSDRRAQSEVLGVVLLLGLTLAGAGVVVVSGSNAIQSMTASADVNRAEHAMTQLDSKASLVAHGSSDSQQVTVARGQKSDVHLDRDAGWMRVVNESTTGSETIIMNESMGAVAYERGRTSLAYQGGGVWRQDTGSGSVMISPPEFHYQGRTLTLPLVLVGGEGSISGGTLRVTRDGAPVGKFPTDAADRSNPLTGGEITVTVKSDYYRAWGQFFEERTGGNASVDHDNRTASIRLAVPTDHRFDNALETTETDGIDINGAGSPPSPSQTGVSNSLPDSQIEHEIQECESDATACVSSVPTGDMDDGETYYFSSGYSGSMTVDTADGDVDVVVNGTLNLGDITVLGNNNVTVYVRDDFTMGGNSNVNVGGDATDFYTLVHSDGAISMSGNYEYVGAIYAPGSDATMSGSGKVTGSVVVDEFTTNGNPSNMFTYVPALRGTDLGLGGDDVLVTFLHVSVNRVNVTAT